MADAKPDLLPRHKTGKDYHEVFTAVAKEASVKLFMQLLHALAGQYGTLIPLLLFKRVAKGIYLHSPIWGHEKHRMYFRLLRAIYGLKKKHPRVTLTTNVFLGNLIQAIKCWPLCFLQRPLLYPAYVAVWPQIRRLGLMELWPGIWYNDLIDIYKSYAGNGEDYHTTSVVIHWQLYLYSLNLALYIF